jgi:hypothetical protein
MISTIVLAIFTVIANTSKAVQPCTVFGYVFIDETIQTPDQIILMFPNQSITADLYNGGFYVVDFNEDIGETGIFKVKIDGKTYTANETVTIQQDIIIYELNLTVDTSSDSNEPPSVKIIEPETGALYFKNWKIPLSFLETSIIIGNITIDINATDADNGVEKVEVTITGLLTEDKIELDDEPYQWNWNTFCLGKYTITARAYDTDGETDEDTITVIKIF